MFKLSASTAHPLQLRLQSDAFRCLCIKTLWLTTRSLLRNVAAIRLPIMMVNECSHDCNFIKATVQPYPDIAGLGVCHKLVHLICLLMLSHLGHYIFRGDHRNCCCSSTPILPVLFRPQAQSLSECGRPVSIKIDRSFLLAFYTEAKV